MVDSKNPSAMLLSVLMGGCPCLCPNSLRVTHIRTATLVLLYTVCASASATEDITLFIVVHLVRKGTLYCIVGVVAVVVGRILSRNILQHGCVRCKERGRPHPSQYKDTHH